LPLWLRGALHSREKGIKELLTRNVDLLTDDAAQLLTQDLLIPTAWLDECRALQARAEHDSWSECALLLSAGLYSEAHKVVVWDLAPEAVVRSDFEVLESMFAELRERQVQVADWQSGGQVRPPLSREIILIRMGRSIWTTSPASSNYQNSCGTLSGIRSSSNGSRSRSCRTYWQTYPTSF
jgi:hypothetical protein